MTEWDAARPTDLGSGLKQAQRFEHTVDEPFAEEARPSSARRDRG